MSFEVLHVLRLKGIASLEVLGGILGRPEEPLRSELEQLAAQELVQSIERPRLSGWRLTATGMARHAEELALQRSDELMAKLAPVYAEFLGQNAAIKELSSAWQHLTPDDSAGRWAAIEELAEIHDPCEGILDRAAGIVDRFSGYRRRLTAALERLRAGDDRYFTGLTVDSYHSVWFECHEDFLQTLGRERAAEGSY